MNEVFPSMVEKYERFLEMNDEKRQIVDVAEMLQNIGIKPVPLKPSSRNAYDDYRSYHNKRWSEHNFINVFGGGNIGVELGRLSRNLFVVIGQKAFYLKLIDKFPQFIKWVSNEDELFVIWFLSSGGSVRNSDDGEYILKGEGYNIFPPSILLSGSYIGWVRKEGNLPPALNTEEIRLLFPNAKVSLVSEPYEWKNPLVIASPQIQELYNRGLNFQWPSRTGSNDQKVFIAFCIRAMFEGKGRIRASDREISVLSGVPLKTANRSKWRLVNVYGLLEIEKNKEKGNGNCFRFSKGIRKILDNPSQSHTNDYLNYLCHDVFRSGALAGSCAIIFDALIKAGHGTVTELSATTGRCRHTVTRVLKKLKKVELAGQVGRTWHSLPYDHEKLDHIAVTLGTDGKGKKMREQFEYDRQRYDERRILRRKNGVFIVGPIIG
jgi:hypothetical protein